MKYTAQELEKIFKGTARMRKGKKDYQNDAGYWDGGRCNWGANHNLREDCETMAQAFNQMESLGEIQTQLRVCNNNQEYEAKKTNYIAKCDRILQGLHAQTSSNSSMFGICIIWADQATNRSVISKIDVYRKGITKLKDDLRRETYKWVQELKSLEVEKSEIEKRMNENKKKASDPNINPVEKAILLQLIEDDGKKLKANLEKQNQLSNKLKFNSEKYTSDLLNSIKTAIKRGGKKDRNGSSGNNPNNLNNSDSDPSDSEDEPGNISLPGPDEIPDPDTNSATPSQNNQQLLIFGAIALVVIYFLMSQKTNDNYDY